jgi:hypothetical protein
MKIKDIQIVQPVEKYNSLAEVSCTHEDLKNSNWKREKFFINKKGEVVAHFENTDWLWVEQLSQNYDDLFILNSDDVKKRRKFKLVKVLKNGTKTILNQFDDMEYGEEDGCFAIKRDNLWGFIDVKGNEIIKPQYKDYCSFASGLAFVLKDEKWGVINKNNETVIPFIYEIPQYTSFEGDYAPVFETGGKCGYIDKLGNVVISFKYDDGDLSFKNAKIFPVKIKNKWGFIDKNENVVIPFEYDEIEWNDSGEPYYSVIKRGNYAVENPTFDTYGLVDAIKGELIIPCDYNLLRPNPNSICVGMLTETKDEKYGLIDYKNNKLTEFIYDKMYDYSYEGLYEVKRNGFWGYLDEKGNEVTDFKYLKIKNFCGGYAIVKNSKLQKALINKKGETIIDFSPKKLFNIGAGMVFVETENRNEYELRSLNK